MKIMQKKICSFIFCLLCISGHLHAKDILASGEYLSTEYENRNIAEEKALLDAKSKSIQEAVILYKKDGLTEDEMKALLFWNIHVKVVDKKIIDTKLGILISINVSATVEEDTFNKIADVYHGNTFAREYKELLRQYQQVQKQTEILVKKRKNEKDTKKADKLKSKIVVQENEFIFINYMDKGYYAYFNDQYQDAINLFSSAIKLKRGSSAGISDAYIYRGLSYHRMKKLEDAISDYKVVISMKPGEMAAHLNLGTAYVEKGLFDKGIDSLSYALELNPKSGDAYDNRGMAFLYKEEYDKAIEDFTRSIAIKPVYVSYYNRGYVYYKKKQYEAALKDETKSIELNPQHAKSYTIRGLSYIDMGDRDRGIADLEKACGMNYTTACTLLKRHQKTTNEFKVAWEYYNRGEIEKADEIVNRLMKTGDKKNKEGLPVLLALIDLRKGLPREALAAIRIIKEKSDEAWPKIKNNDTKLSQEDKEAVIELRHLLMYITGVAHFQLKDCTKSLNELLPYAEMKKDPYVFDIIGTCYNNTKEYSKALLYYKQSYEVATDGLSKDNAAYQISRTYALLGMHEESIKWLNEPLEHSFRKDFLEKVKQDDSFDDIKDTKKFKQLLK